MKNCPYPINVRRYIHLVAGILALSLAGCRHPETTPARSGKPLASTLVSPEAKLGAHMNDTLMEFRTQPRSLEAGKMAIWTLNIWKKNGAERVENLQLTHDKLMHLIVVSRDLSFFQHLRPEPKDDGLFITNNTLPVGGRYKIYAEYTPYKGTMEVGQQEIKVTHPPDASPVLHDAATLIADAPRQGRITQRVAASGEHSAPNVRTYEVSLQAPQLVAGQRGRLHFRVRDEMSRPLHDLQPWAGTLGHLCAISANTNIYVHPDAITPEGTVISGPLREETGGPDVLFSAIFPKAGLYKTWAEFKHDGAIITASFVLKVRAK